jgi:hypothetical protein
MTTETERAKQLADAHWNGYVGELLRAFGVNVADADGFNFISAFQHGYKHAVEDIRAGMFRPQIGPDYIADEVERISESLNLDGGVWAGAGTWTPHPDEITPPHPGATLCRSCQRDGHCIGYYPTTEDGGCEGYISSLRERIAEAKEPQALDLSLPSITLECTAAEAYAKYLEECAEVDKAETVLHSLIELWDCIQAIQTSIEKGGEWQSLYAGLMDDMLDRERRGNQVLLARRAMLMKNAARWRYSDSVNRIIIESNGERWK